MRQTAQSNGSNKPRSADGPSDSSATKRPTVSALFLRWFYSQEWHAALIVVPCWLAAIICAGEVGGPYGWLLYLLLIIVPIWWSNGPFRRRHEQEKRRWWQAVMNHGSRSDPKAAGGEKGI